MGRLDPRQLFCLLLRPLLKVGVERFEAVEHIIWQYLLVGDNAITAQILSQPNPHFILGKPEHIIQVLVVRYDIAEFRSSGGHRAVRQPRPTGRHLFCWVGAKLTLPPGPRPDLKMADPTALSPITERMPPILVSHGLNKTDRQYDEVAVSDIETYLKMRTDCYERTVPTEHDPKRIYNRVYIDVDGKPEPDILKHDFNTLHDNICDALNFAIDDDVCIMTASQWPSKLSYRIHYTKRHGTKAAIKHYAETVVYPKLAEALSAFAPLTWGKPEDETVRYLNIDKGLYGANRKMRMVWQSKDGEKRPLRMVDGTRSVEDTLITYIPADSELIPEPEAVAPPLTALDPSENVIVIKEENDGDLIAKLLSKLALKRCNDHDDWVRAGIICFNEGVPLKVWDDWSKKGSGYRAGECAKRWKSFKRGNISQATLWRWLREDNPTAFEALRGEREDIWRLMSNPSHAETARFFYNIKPEAYIYNESLLWFQLMPTGVWKHYEKIPSGLKFDIYQTMAAVAKDAWATLDPTTQDPVLKERNEGRTKAVKSFSKFVSTSFQVDGIMAFLSSLYNDDDLPKKMDESRHLFAFRNAVVDLDKGGEVRPIRPSDYVSLHTGYDYPAEPSEEAFKRLSDILYSIWEDAEILSYVLKTMATCLHGVRKFERFYVWTGRGGNGKSLLGDLTKRAFGDYFSSIPHSCLTKTSDKKDATNSSIATIKGKRFIQATEPESEDKLQVGTIKELTGGEEVIARQLYRAPVTFVPQGGLFLQTNNIPKLNRPDGGIQRRMRVVGFPFQFVDECVEENHRPIDVDLKDLINSSDELRAAFIHSLIKIFPTIGPLTEPKAIKELTSDYMDSNNPVKDWIAEHYKTGLDINDKRYWIESGELRRKFCSDTSMAESAMSSDKFKGYMLLLGVQQKRMGNKFSSQVWDEFSKTWIDADRKSGMFWMGIARQAACEA